LDNGIVNRFKIYLNNNKISDEEAYRTAYSNLYIKNIKIIEKKLNEKIKRINERNEAFQIQTEQNLFHIDVFFDLIKEILLLFEKSNLENVEIRNLSTLVAKQCELYIDRIENDPKIVTLKDKLKSLTTDSEKINNYYGIARIDQSTLKFLSEDQQKTEE
jgi:uncharacterized transporter YbjL